jgi:hypothetical protein
MYPIIAIRRIIPITMRKICMIPEKNPRIPPLFADSSIIFWVSSGGIFSCPPLIIVRSWVFMRILSSLLMAVSS